MQYKDYYDTVKPDELINPDDLLKPFTELVAKAELLDQAEAPRMLTYLMFSLALEIEIGRRNSLVVINPENPEPMTIALLALNAAQEAERIKIIKALKKAGWAIKPTTNSNLIELSVAKFEPATV